jgi:hypothetical protein
VLIFFHGLSVISAHIAPDYRFEYSKYSFLGVCLPRSITSGQSEMAQPSDVTFAAFQQVWCSISRSTWNIPASVGIKIVYNEKKKQVASYGPFSINDTGTGARA